MLAWPYTALTHRDGAEIGGEECHRNISVRKWSLHNLDAYCMSRNHCNDPADGCGYADAGDQLTYLGYVRWMRMVLKVMLRVLLR